MSERRSYFRIDETIALEFKAIDDVTANKVQAETLFSNANSLKLYSELKKIDADNAQFLFQIKELSRPLAEYLHNLNRKIELLGQELMADQKPLPPSKTIRQVNLSEGGIAFGSSTAINAGDYIGLRIVFLPSNTGLILFARIIRCEPSNTGEFQIAAKFHRINDLQQQLIGQQIMRAQMAEKRRLQESQWEKANSRTSIKRKAASRFIVKKLFLSILFVVCVSPVLVSAEDIKIPIGTTTPETKQIARPVTGATKAQVKSQFGAPIKENAPKGNPPISNWEYAEFTVYFENNHVIHSVIKPKLHESKEIIIETIDEMSEDDLKPK